MALPYDAWYFSRINVCSAAAALTASSSQVLVGRVEPGAVLFVALGTYVVYAVDDLLDRRTDEARFPAIVSLCRARLAMSVCAIPASLAALAYLTVQRSQVAPWHLVSQACLSVGFCAATLRWPHLEQQRHWSVTRALIVSFVWASVCALTPLWWTGRPLSFLAVRAVVFLWQLLFVIVLLWEEGESASHAPAERRPRPLLAHPAARRGLLAVCVCSALMVCASVALGHSPPANLAVASASAVNFFAVRSWTGSGVDGRVRNDLLIAANNACCALVLAAYAVSRG